ncbi:MAG TPA: NTP transferase domain-containing protein [Nocardioides sp.]|nr:NTP transferase domain-containing protein [Nocardioides sp.]
MDPLLGVVLAAGAGRRYGGPKAFVLTPGGETWLSRTCEVLLEGGCSAVVATVPVGGDLPTLGPRVTVLPLRTSGQSESLAAALDLAIARGAVGVVVMLVDLPDVGASVVERVVAGGVEADSLVRAAYDGRPGHPVLIGSAHLAPLLGSLTGDTGANAYLKAHGVQLVECGDLATGIDVDRPSRSTPAATSADDGAPT